MRFFKLQCIFEELTLFVYGFVVNKVNKVMQCGKRCINGKCKCDLNQ